MSTHSLRHSARGLVDAWLAEGRFEPACDAWLRRHDPAFTHALAERGLIGLTWPAELGGRGVAGAVRLAVTEELLRRGAPVAAHWIADRQIGPAILEHGSDAARQRFLPGIASGEVTFCLGMSEPGSGSDLASVATRAVPVSASDGGGWRITGQKIWTSQAHRSTHAYVLARTGGERQEGLTEFLLDLAAPGVEVRPIHDLAGEHHFNEVFLDGVHVDDDHVLGTVGGGWTQVTEQLSLERGGIERVLSTYPLFEAVLGRSGTDPERLAAIGATAARYAALRAMARDVTREIDAGRRPVVEAALLKDLGTDLEVDVVEVGRRALCVVPDHGAGDDRALLASAVVAAPGFTIRGGTTEVLRGIVARSLRGPRTGGARGDLAVVVDDVLSGRGGEPDDLDTATRDLVSELGWSDIGVPEAAGGDGGTLADVVEVVAGLGRHAVSLPVAETVVAARALREAVPLGRVAVAAAAGSVVDGGPVLDGGTITGTLSAVPWAVDAERLVAVVEEAGRAVVVAVRVGADGCRTRPGRNLAGEPRDEVVLDAAPAERLEVAADVVVAELALLRAAAVLGAVERALAHAVEHARGREQFGRPLEAFQAVGHLLAGIAAEAAQLRAAVGHAVGVLERDGDPSDRWLSAAAARVVADRAATRGARAAHQVHAAMGITREHPLHLTTRRLWSWRDDGGPTRTWEHELGRRLAAAGPDRTWAWITDSAHDEGDDTP